MAYVPTLKGKRGEFTALGQIKPDEQVEVRPIMEVVLDERLRDVVETFRKNAWNQLPKGLDIAVDCGGLWHHGAVGGVWTGRPMNWISEASGARMLALIPAFRPDDPLGALARAWGGHVVGRRRVGEVRARGAAEGRWRSGMACLGHLPPLGRHCRGAANHGPAMTCRPQNQA
ncbi:hypothetical protein [Streptomyces axinellae]|uniref:Transposase n=1 Tax=Streptomyces axinellae TaxID=552788 RepID=A0ABP6CA27_9ACTN